MHVMAPGRLPFALAHVEMPQMNAPSHGQQQSERKIRHCFIQQPRRVGHHDALPCGGWNIDRVITYAPARNQLKFVRGLAVQYLGIEVVHARSEERRVGKESRVGWW